jgi:glutamate carboxypeptidase
MSKKCTDQPLQQALEWISQQERAMLQLLYQWVEINSHTHHLVGLKKMHTAIALAFSQLSADSKTIPVEPYSLMNDQGIVVKHSIGDCYHLKSQQRGQKKVFLCGHMDTVYSIDDTFQIVQQGENQLCGPGVSDMKSGLVIMLYSLFALEKYDLNADLTWEVMINADEEIGSPCSTPWIKQFAQGCDVGLVFEPALDCAGTFVNERKGSAKYTMTARGKAAHAGRDITLGRNAIVALAQAIQAVTQLSNEIPGLTINVGQMNGGKAVNVVPDFALCRLDVRYEKNEDLDWLEKSIENVLQRITQQTQVKLQFDLQNKRCPKIFTPATKQLFQLLAECSQALQLPFAFKQSGGCCDGNTIAMAGIPVIDTLGGCGEHIHSPQEKLMISSLVQRTQLTTLLLARLK